MTEKKIMIIGDGIYHGSSFLRNLNEVKDVVLVDPEIVVPIKSYHIPEMLNVARPISGQESRRERRKNQRKNKK